MRDLADNLMVIVVGLDVERIAKLVSTEKYVVDGIEDGWLTNTIAPTNGSDVVIEISKTVNDILITLK